MERLGMTFATVGVVAMALATVVVVTALDDWIGDLGALLWVCACFFIPFIAGIAWGMSGLGVRGRLAGALLGGTIALVPSLTLPLAGVGPMNDGATVSIVLVVFTCLGMAQGAIALPVGASARKKRRAV